MSLWRCLIHNRVSAIKGIQEYQPSKWRYRKPHHQALVTRVAWSRFSRTVALSDRAGLGAVRNRSVKRRLGIPVPAV